MVSVDRSNGLGDRLRRQRAERGLTLRELARRLDVSPSLVSQIETGKTQPSVRTLYAIVSELGVSLDDVFGDGLTGPPQTDAVTLRRTDGSGAVQRADARQALDLESGVRWERLTTRNEPGVEFLFLVYPPGADSGASDALVRHNGREFGLVLSGRLGLTVGFDEHVLEAGDSILFDSTIPHRLHNDGDEEMRAVWVVLGRRPDDARTELFTLS